MAFNVIWTAKAKLTYFKVLDYLEQHWSQKEIVQFANRTEIIIHAITKNPYIYPASVKYHEIRKAIIDRNNSFFYTIDNTKNEIYLLTFFDNRQNPENLKL